MKIVTLYAENNEVNYYNCIVTTKVYYNLLLLSNMGGFKRFSVDYEDDTTNIQTDLKDLYEIFLSKVFPKCDFKTIKIELTK